MLVISHDRSASRPPSALCFVVGAIRLLCQRGLCSSLCAWVPFSIAVATGLHPESPSRFQKLQFTIFPTLKQPHHTPSSSTSWQQSSASSSQARLQVPGGTWGMPLPHTPEGYPQPCGTPNLFPCSLCPWAGSCFL